LHRFDCQTIFHQLSSFVVFFSADGLKWLNDAFKFCTPLKGKDDVTKLKAYLNNLWTDLVMMDYPYPTNFLMPLPGNPVQVSHLYSSQTLLQLNVIQGQ
jgi:hypothetical protein